MNKECMSRIVLERLQSMNVTPTVLPLGAAKDEKHIKILTTPNLASATRLLLIFPDSEFSGLGVLSFRYMVDVSLRFGSMETLVASAQSAGYDGIVITNPACIYWDETTHSAITHSSARARDLANTKTTGSILVSDAYLVPGHESPEKHIASVLSYLSTLLHPKAKVDFIACGYSAYGALAEFYRLYDGFWENHLHTGVLTESSHAVADLPHPLLREFLRRRCRNYIVHADPAGTYLPPNLITGVATFSSEVTDHGSGIVPKLVAEIMEYFKEGWEKEEINPDIPILLNAEELGNGESAWMEALKKMNLGGEVAGWDFEGKEEVEELRRKADEEKVVIESWENKAREIGDGTKIEIIEEA